MSEMLWQPTEEQIKSTQMDQFRLYVNDKLGLNLASYQELYEWSVTRISEFWGEFWHFSDLVFSCGYNEVLERGDHISKCQWYKGARLNYAENLLRYKDERIAIIFANENGVQQNISYKELHVKVAKARHYLVKCGVVEGDRVAGYLPNMPEAIIFMLATIALGAIWSSSSPDFGEQGVVDRFSQIEPKVLVAVDGYLYNSKLVNISNKVQAILAKIPSIKNLVVVDYINQSTELLQLSNSIDYRQINAELNYAELTFAQVPFDHPGFILYSSGTTGLPKTIVHRAGGVLMTHIKEHRLHTDLRREDVLIYFTTTGWMMWNWLVSGLATGCTVVCYDGSPFAPSKSSLWELSEKLGVTVFGTSAKYLASLEQYNVHPGELCKLSSLRAILSTGSILADHSFDYIYSKIKPGILIGSVSGGTDIVSCFVLGNPVLPVYRGESQSRGLGYAILAYNEDGKPVIGEEGELVCTEPFPSMPVGFWHDEHNEKFLKAYFSVYDNVWYHGDFIIIYPHGGVRILGRSDTTLNPQGVRIGTGEIYQVVENIEEILDSLVVGQAIDNDERVILFVQLSSGQTLTSELTDKIKNIIKKECSPRHVPAKVIAVSDIPYTINNKKVEIAVKNIINGKEVKNQNVLRNPESLELYMNLDELKS